MHLQPTSRPIEPETRTRREENETERCCSTRHVDHRSTQHQCSACLLWMPRRPVMFTLGHATSSSSRGDFVHHESYGWERSVVIEISGSSPCHLGGCQSGTFQ